MTDSRNPRILILFCILFFLTLIAVVTWQWDAMQGIPGFARTARPVDYVVPHHEAAYRALMETHLTPDKPDRTFLDSLSPSELTTETVMFKYHARINRINRQLYANSVNHINADDLPTSGPYIEPLAIGISKLNNPTQEQIRQIRSNNLKMPFQYYTLSGKKMEGDERSLFGHYLTHREFIYCGETNLQFVFTMQNLDRPYVVNQKFFDATTLTPLSISRYGQTSGKVGKADFFRRSVFVFHPAKLQCVVDVAHTPVKTIDIPAEKDAIADFGDVYLRVVTDMLDGYSGGTMNGNSGNEGFTGFRIHQRSGNNRRLMIVGMTPSCLSNLITIQALDADKKPWGKEMTFSDRFLTVISMKPDIRYLRIRRYKEVTRFVVDLGEIPDTPPQNRNTKDLMDVHISFIRFEYEAQIYEFLENILQLDISPMRKLRTMSIPVEYENVTPREIIEDIMDIPASDYKYEVDLEKGELIFKEPVLFIEHLQDFFERLLN